jgi:hypothetical protein
MDLSPELFQEITESITVVAEDEPRPVDRRAPRLQLNTHLALVPWEHPSEALSVRVQNLSAGGMGILYSQRLSLDERFVARLPCRQSQTALLLCTVIYWEPLAENLYAIGVRFDRLIEEAELARHQADLSQEPAGILARLGHAFARRRKIAS